MDSETQARVWAAAHGLPFKVWARDADHKAQFDAVVDAASAYWNQDGKGWAPMPDLLSWPGCGALIEAMQAKGWFFTMNQLSQDNGKWSVTVFKEDDRGTWYGPKATPLLPLPLAVARAAAAALGVEEGRAC
jgi:hypothetical protein